MIYTYPTVPYDSYGMSQNWIKIILFGNLFIYYPAQFSLIYIQYGPSKRKTILKFYKFFHGKFPHWSAMFVDGPQLFLVFQFTKEFTEIVGIFYIIFSVSV